MKKAAILAAGEGSRLKKLSEFKPIVKIYGSPLLEITFNNLDLKRFPTVQIIFNEYEKNMNLTQLTCLKLENVNYFFKSTPSSMHSLYEVSKKLGLQNGEHFFVTMVDSIIMPEDAKLFHDFCSSLNKDESGIIVTSYIEDESPLTLKIDNEGYISDFQCPRGENVYVTSGVYYFSESIVQVLEESIESGQLKMRNFLADLIRHNHKIKAFYIDKSLDIDRPEDIKDAEIFISGV